VRCAHQHQVEVRVWLVGWNRSCALWAVGAPPTETHHAHASKVQTTSAPFPASSCKRITRTEGHVRCQLCAASLKCRAWSAYASTELGDVPKVRFGATVTPRIFFYIALFCSFFKCSINL
jgi:hypothetical protein